MVEPSSSIDAHTAATGKSHHPAHWDDLVSQRSKLFYDGTYQWNGTDGFWDDSGIYHEFNDPNDPEAFPPTPRPVGSWLEEDEMQVVEGAPDKLSTSLDHQDPISLPSDTQELTDVLGEEMLAKCLQAGSQVLLIKGNTHNKTLLRDDLFLDHPNRERLLGQIEGMLVGKHMLGKKLDLVDSYKLCGMVVPPALLAVVDGRAPNAAPNVDTKSRAASISEIQAHLVHVENGAGQLNGLNIVEKAAEVDYTENTTGLQGEVKEADSAEGVTLGSSPFSDCPSDLSTWEVEDQVKYPGHATTQKLVLDLKGDNTSNESGTENLKSSTGAKARGGSVDSAIDIPTRRRSTRIFLASK